jgi:hypothetical protein
MKPTRGTAFKLWLACTLALPLLWIMQLGQGLFGSAERSVEMATALDACGNALLGGTFRMTISERAGLAQIQGKRWARFAVSLIDALFYSGHCADEAMDWLRDKGKLHGD